jgi:hypothetical protein
MLDRVPAAYKSEMIRKIIIEGMNKRDIDDRRHIYIGRAFGIGHCN